MTETPLYRLRPSNRAKRLALRLDPIERIFDLVVPARCRTQVAVDFAEQYEGWMLERLEALPPPIPFRHGQVIPIHGQNTRIDVTFEHNRKNTTFNHKDNVLQVRTNQEVPASRIKRWLQAHAKDILRQKSLEKAHTIQKKIENISVRDTKSRWGSCAATGHISYSWRLIFAPPDALDYVVAHEVAHLVHLNHSKAFWSLCRSLSDDFMNGQYWMRQHGHELMRYGFVDSASNAP